MSPSVAVTVSLHKGFPAFHLFRRGWEDGCVARVEREPQCEEPLRKAYRDGYAEGRKARLAMVKRAMKRTGYVPNPLRSDLA